MYYHHFRDQKVSIKTVMGLFVNKNRNGLYVASYQGRDTFDHFTSLTDYRDSNAILESIAFCAGIVMQFGSDYCKHFLKCKLTFLLTLADLALLERFPACSRTYSTGIISLS